MTRILSADRLCDNNAPLTFGFFQPDVPQMPQRKPWVPLRIASQLPSAMLQQEWGRSVKCDQSENGKMARRARDDRVIEFPYLVMFRNENGHLRLGRRRL